VWSSDTQRTHTTLRVFSFPLLGTFPGNVPGPSDTLGVFQIALNVLGVDDMNSTVLLGVFDQIAAALSCNLQLIMNIKSIHDNSEKIMLECQHARDKLGILLEEKKLWQARSAMWESVSESAMVMLSGAVKGGAVTFSEALSLAQGNQLVMQKELGVSHHAIQPTISDDVDDVLKTTKSVKEDTNKKIRYKTKRSKKENAMKSSVGAVEKDNKRNLDEKRIENYPSSDACKRKNEEREERYRDPRVRAVRALQNIISNVEILHDIKRGASAAANIVNNT
jgi:microcompartment protein CcmL/EutN